MFVRKYVRVAYYRHDHNSQRNIRTFSFSDGLFPLSGPQLYPKINIWALIPNKY